MSRSEPSSPTNSETTPGTPSRRSRLSEHVGRARGESRSSSVPVIVHSHEDQESDHEGSAQQQPSSLAGFRNTSPLPSPAGNPDGRDRRSVKHLTCFWFWTKGGCKYSDEECRELNLTSSHTFPPKSLTIIAVYAHYDTGNYTAAPRRVVPGEPAKAGKSLERALSKIALTNRSSASSLGAAGTANPSGDSLSVRPATPFSRPGTPYSPRGRSLAGTPSPRGSVDFTSDLRVDNDFLRGIVEETQREKRILEDKVANLEQAKSQMTTNVDKIKEDYDNLRRERDALQAVVRALQFPTGVNPYAQNGLVGAAMRPASTAGPPAQHNPWGAIGSTRASSSSGPGTPVETLADSPPLQQRYFSYPSTGSGGLQPVNAVATTRMSYASALYPAAPAYGSAIRLGQNGGNNAAQNNANTSNGDEDEEMRHQNEVLRHLGSGF
ncbi:hypothetical protein H2200_011508 [Cladophialophora chaetospira]|uniref:C3H1-type domain-containing protein n=1 Tax=Cladophialophora chaetospira TaxID=386627 RepID=A0AA38WZF5_9EURO|nr:hypothetical protein H2200_011508 [Cladophialophora chaetospira]